MARASGSMMRATAKALLTGIKVLRRSSIGERLRMPQNRGKPSAAVRIRADRTFPAAVAIAGAVSGNQALPSGVVGIVLLEEVSEAVKRDNKVAVAVRAVRA